MIAFEVWSGPVPHDAVTRRLITEQIDLASFSDHSRLAVRSALAAVPHHHDGADLIGVVAVSTDGSSGHPTDHPMQEPADNTAEADVVAAGMSVITRGSDADLVELVGPMYAEAPPPQGDTSTSLSSDDETPAATAPMKTAPMKMAMVQPELLRTIVAAYDALGNRRQLRLWLDTLEGDVATAAAELGFTTERSIHQMSADLPLRATADADRPDHLNTRPFDPDRDTASWLELNNRAFAGHGEQGHWGVDDLNQRIDEPWFDPTGFLIYEEHGEMVGFCWTKRHSPSMGEIYVIGVDPRVAGRGLGTRLTIAGLDTLHRAGATEATLWVDGHNVAARHMYEHLGFVDVATRYALTRGNDQ